MFTLFSNVYWVLFYTEQKGWCKRFGLWIDATRGCAVWLSPPFPGLFLATGVFLLDKAHSTSLQEALLGVMRNVVVKPGVCINLRDCN